MDVSPNPVRGGKSKNNFLFSLSLFHNLAFLLPTKYQVTCHIWWWPFYLGPKLCNIAFLGRHNFVRCSQCPFCLRLLPSVVVCCLTYPARPHKSFPGPQPTILPHPRFPFKSCSPPRYPFTHLVYSDLHSKRSYFFWLGTLLPLLFIQQSIIHGPCVSAEVALAGRWPPLLCFIMH